ncbi:MAG: T9SS type A sorting domain-containing protein [Lentimicrobiaceae bacterium]|nr:T9SS type A sorting domain-containing protein [Lentimicrobiaceae bacterium]
MSNRRENFRSLIESYDGGNIILGSYDFFPDTRGWIIKTDINGNVLYDLTIGMPGSGLGNLNYPSFLSTTSDGGFIICGSHDRWTVNDIGITKHDACGDLEWCKVFRTDDNSPDWGVEIQQLQDGGYIMLTMGYSANSNNPRIHLFRLNATGDVLWIEPYALTANHPFISYNEPYDLVVTPDEDFFIGGLCYWCDDSVATGGINNRCRLKAMAILADSSRQEEWVSVYKATDTLAYSIAGWATQHESGSFYVGAVDQSIWPSSLPRLLKYDINGNLLADSLVDIPLIDNKWAEGFMVNPSFTEDGKLFACTRFVDENTPYPGWFGLHELDSLGGWHNSIIHRTAHAPVGLMVTSDNKLLAGAVVGSELDQDIILMKFNTSLAYDSIYTAPREYDYLCPDPIVSKTIDLSDCDVIVNVENIPTRKEYEARISLIPITPAPNPAKDYIRFLLENTEYHRNIRVVCYDIFGRQLAELPVNAGVNETGLDVSGWRPGLYMAVVYSGNKQMGKAKFVVE